MYCPINKLEITILKNGIPIDKPKKRPPAQFMACQYLQAFRAVEFFDLVDGNVSRSKHFSAENVKYLRMPATLSVENIRLSHIGNFTGGIKYFVLSAATV